MKVANIRMETLSNRAYLASVLRTFAQIQPIGWNLDTLGTLAEIPIHCCVKYINLMRGRQWR